MDWLLETRDGLEKRVFDSLVTLLNLEADVLFFDTTSTDFVAEDEDEPVARGVNGMPLTSEDTGATFAFSEPSYLALSRRDAAQRANLGTYQA
jgi:hypothetical protein